MQVEIFEKIKNGIIKRTNDFQVESIRRGTDDSYKYNTYIAILDMISEGYVKGNNDIQGYLAKLQVVEFLNTWSSQRDYFFLATSLIAL